MPVKAKHKRSHVGRIPEPSTAEEKIFVLEFALKIAVQAHTEREKGLSALLEQQRSENWRLRKKVETLEREIKEMMKF